MRASGPALALPCAVLLFFLGGCATLSREQAREAFAPLLDEYRQEAGELQKAGEKRAAFEKLRAVAAFHPDDDALRAEMSNLGMELKKSAEAHFGRGRKLFNGGKSGAARREFILALADDPDHAGALDYLKNRFHRDSASHTVAAGESLKNIASRSYGNPEAAVMIARLNDLGPGEEPRPGSVIAVPPFMDPDHVPGTGSGGGDTAAAAGMVEGYLSGSEEMEEQSELAVARGYLAAGNFEEALVAAKALATGGESALDARELVNAAYYGLGRKFHEEERYFDALNSLEKADSSYRDVKKIISAVRKDILSTAEEHYLAGVRSFVDQKLEDAIEQWEKTLELNPGHSKAKKDIVKARKLIEHLQKIR